MLRRVLIMLSILTLANVYVATSFYLATGWRGVWWSFALIYFLEVMMPTLRFQGERWGQARPGLKPFLWALGVLSMMAVGLFSLLFFFSAVRDLMLLVAGVFLSPSHFESFASRSLQFELGLTVAVVVVGLYQALIGPGIRRVQVPLKGLPKAFDGFRIVQVSDLHIGPTIRDSYVGNVVRAVNELKADMIALTGDITDGLPSELASIAKKLAEMQSTYGRFFVTGNHEYYHDAPGWIRLHRDSGTHVLVNESRIIEKEGAQLAVLGVPDVSGHHFVKEHVSDPAQAAVKVPGDVIKILLAHQPVSYKAAHAAGVNLQLSGHTHSGQFFPWNLVIGFFHDFYRDLNRFQEMWIYVNPGTGYWGPPLRTAVASEITLLTLVTEV